MLLSRHEPVQKTHVRKCQCAMVAEMGAYKLPTKKKPYLIDVLTECLNHHVKKMKTQKIKWEDKETPDMQKELTNFFCKTSILHSARCLVLLHKSAESAVQKKIKLSKLDKDELEKLKNDSLGFGPLEKMILREAWLL